MVILIPLYIVKLAPYKGKPIVKKINALTEKEIALNIKNSKTNIPFKSKLSPPYYSFTTYAAHNAALIKLESFEKNPWKAYTNFLDSCFAELEKNKIKNLIIDLRWNIGGPREYPIYLYSRISEKPFSFCKELITTSETVKEKLPLDSEKVFEKLDDNFYVVKSNARGLGLQSPSQNPYRGKIFLLIDGQSNSASAQFASIFYSNKRGVIIGEEAGGLFTGGTGEHHYYLKLPSSKITVQIPRYRIVLDVDQNKFYGHGLKPHHEVNESVDQLIKEKIVY